jgi:hypothetical protein
MINAPLALHLIGRPEARTPCEREISRQVARAEPNSCPREAELSGVKFVAAIAGPWLNAGRRAAAGRAFWRVP